MYLRNGLTARGHGLNGWTGHPRHPRGAGAAGPLKGRWPLRNKLKLNSTKSTERTLIKSEHYYRSCTQLIDVWWNFKLSDVQRSQRPTSDNATGCPECKINMKLFGTKFVQAALQLENIFRNRLFPPENQQTTKLNFESKWKWSLWGLWSPSCPMSSLWKVHLAFGKVRFCTPRPVGRSRLPYMVIWVEP